MPPELPHNRTCVQRPPSASIAIQHSGAMEPWSHRSLGPACCQQLGDGDGSRHFYTIACRGVTCSAI